MDNNEKKEKKEVLNNQELIERAEGHDLSGMIEHPGFLILKAQLEGMAFHSWIDPREIDGPDAKKEWEWRELNGFHAANNAKELLEWIQQKISKAQYLEKKRRGEVGNRSLRIA